MNPAVLAALDEAEKHLRRPYIWLRVKSPDGTFSTTISLKPGLAASLRILAEERHQSLQEAALQASEEAISVEGRFWTDCVVEQMKRTLGLIY